MAIISMVFSWLISITPALHTTTSPFMSSTVTSMELVQQSAPQYTWCSNLLPTMKLSCCQKFPSWLNSTERMPYSGARKVMMVCQGVT